MLRCGETAVAVPSTLIEIVRRATPAEIEQAHAGGTYLLGERVMPFFWLGALLQLSPAFHRERRAHPDCRCHPQCAETHCRAGRRSAGQPGSGGEEPRPAVVTRAWPGGHHAVGIGCGGADLQPGGAWPRCTVTRRAGPRWWRCTSPLRRPGTGRQEMLRRPRRWCWWSTIRSPCAV